MSQTSQTLIIPYLEEHIARILSATNPDELASIALEIIGSRAKVGYLDHSKPYAEMTKEEILLYQQNLECFADTVGKKSGLVFFNPLEFEAQIENLRQKAEYELKELEATTKERYKTLDTVKLPAVASEKLKKARAALLQVSDKEDGEVLRRFYRKVFAKCERIFFLPGYEATTVRFHFMASEHMQIDTKKIPTGWREKVLAA